MGSTKKEALVVLASPMTKNRKDTQGRLGLTYQILPASSRGFGNRFYFFATIRPRRFGDCRNSAIALARGEPKRKEMAWSAPNSEEFLDNQCSGGSLESKREPGQG